jgi:membrane-bound lytic murein transglycosylase B
MHKFILFLILAFVFQPGVASAQSACTSDTSNKSRAELERELETCNKEIEQWTKTLNETKEQSASYSRDVSALTAKINAAQANIKAKNIAISNLAKDIALKQSEIKTIESRIERSRKAIAEILRKTNDIRSYSLVEAMLSDKDLSEFFVDIDTYASTEEALDNLFAELRADKALTEAEKTVLDKKRQAEAEARAAMEAAKKEVEIAQADKKTLLAASQSAEKSYAQVLADRQAKAAKIKAILFPLVDAGAIPFGTALQYAEDASRKTGVRAALILGILQQESNLGANVGRCIITDISSGQTKNVTSGYVWANGIHPTRDLPLLKSILEKLGRDPLSTRVSCPIAGIAGYGGAMGPTQFIPSTWNLVAPKVANAMGKDTADPWNPADAIMAAAFLLQGNGAAAGGYTAERTAACRYYSGRICSTASHIAAYGNQVLSRASTIQLTMIDPLQNL